SVGRIPYCVLRKERYATKTLHITEYAIDFHGSRNTHHACHDQSLQVRPAPYPTMTHQFFLDWSALSVSLFNASLLTWLGLTVALNSERPRGGARLPGAGWGTALIAASLLMGGLFFVAHSALLTYDLNTASRGLDFWWRLGGWPVVLLPAAWYVV